MRVFRPESSDFLNAYGIACAPMPSAQDRRGLYPTFCRVPVQGATAPHSHFEAEIFFIVRGRGRMRIGDENREVAGGDLVSIPSFADHDLTNLGEEELEFISVYSEDFEVPAIPARALVTAAPPTPNGPLHLGHMSGPYLAADIAQRYLRLRGANVESSCGTDDHQNYVSERARQLGTEPEAFRAKMRERIERGLAKFNISFDVFTEPTRDEAYARHVAHFVARAEELGVIRRETVAFPYCASCDEFLLDALIEGECPNCSEESRGGCENCGIVVPPQELRNPHCSRCQTPAVSREAEAGFFDLGQHLPAVIDELRGLSLPARLRNFVESIAARPRCQVLVTYPGGSAGALARIGARNEKIHVWTEMAAHYSRFANDSAYWVHCFGFDNAFYYLLFIPAFLRALDPHARLPDAIVANEFLLLDDAKFSTSRGHAIWADEFDGPTEHLRLYLALVRPAPAQSNFSMDDFRSFSQNLAKLLAAARERSVALGQSSEKGRATGQSIVEANRAVRDLEKMLSPTTFDLRQAARRVLAFLDYAIQGHGTGSDQRLVLRALVPLLAPFLPLEAQTLAEALGDRHIAWVRDWGMVP